MQLWMLLIIVLVPLTIAPGLLSDFDVTPKIAILLFCEFGLLLFCKQLVKSVPALWKTTPGRLFLGCLGALCLSAVASTLGSSNPLLSVAGSRWRRDGLIAELAILVFAFFVAAWCVGNPLGRLAILRATVITGAALSIYGIAQYFGWDPLLPSKAYQAGEGIFTIVRPPGTLGHADYFADWLVMIVFLALALRAVEEDVLWKATGGATVLLAGFAIVLSGTRSALLGLLVGTIVFVTMVRPRIDRRALLAAGAVVACLGLLYISPAGAKLRARVKWSLDDVRGGARPRLWRDSLRMAATRPVLGYGVETFTSQFPSFVSVDLARAYPDFYHESPHNMFLDALTSRGIPGLFSLLAICALAFWAASMNPVRNAPFAAALAGAIVCQQFIVLTIPTALYFYLLIAMIIASAAPATRQDWAVRYPRALTALAVALGMVFFVFASRLLVADHSMARAERLTEKGDVAGASSAHQTVLRWEVYPSTDLRYSRAMTHLAAVSPVFATSVAAAQQALDAAIRATETAEDRQNAWYNLATIAALRNEPTGVEKALRSAIAFAPNWFKPHWTLSQFLELSGRHAEARTEAVLALELDGAHDPEVVETYNRILSRP